MRSQYGDIEDTRCLGEELWYRGLVAMQLENEAEDAINFQLDRSMALEWLGSDMLDKLLAVI